MRTKKVIFAMSLIAFAILSAWNSGFAQIEKGESFFYSGIINTVSGDSKSITVNKKSFVLAGEIKIVDQKGNKLGIYDLKPGIHVAIDAIQGPLGFVIKKIVIIKDTGV